MVTQLPFAERFFPSYVLQYRASWTDDWTTLPVDNLKCSVTLGSAISEASFLLRGGFMRHILATGNAGNVPAFTLASHAFESTLANTWVKITAATQSQVAPLLWYGRMTDATEDVAGDATEDMQIQCYDFRWMLTRKQVDSSELNGGVTIKRALPFNETFGGTLRGNKHSTNDLFTDDLDNATLWTVGDAIRYLLANFPPDDALTWELEDNAVTDVLDEHTAYLPNTHGQTVYALIDALMPRNRGISWTIEVFEGTSKAVIHPVSLVGSDITLPGSSVVIPASADQYSFDIHTQRDIEATLNYSEQNRFDAVKVEGARKVGIGTFTIGSNADDLQPNWSAADVTRYNAGAQSVVDAEDQEPFDEAFRTSFPMNQVYSSFRLSSSWAGEANGSLMIPEHDSDGDPTASASEIYLPNLRFLESLPLNYALDYSTPGSPSLKANAVDRGQLTPIFASIAYNGGRYDVTRLPRNFEAEVIPFSMTPQVLETTPTVRLDVSCPPHVIAGSAFNNATHAPGDFPKILDYTTLEFTLAVEYDEYISYTYPESPTAYNDLLQVHTIRIGDRAQWIYIAGGTVLGLTELGAKVTATAGLARNDFALLKDTARQAYEWYGSERRAIDLRIKQINEYFRPGTFVTTVTQATGNVVTVNTAVSMVEYDFQKGSQRVTTSFAEIDFGAF